MEAENNSESVAYKAVVNDQEQYSIWPIARPNPAGWSDGGRTGTREDILRYIARTWTDMRPSAVRRPPANGRQGAASSSDATGCVHHLVERQVETRPGAIALICAGHSLTYSELNTRANRLARRLRRRGAGPEDIIGICLPPSVDAAIAGLAILKAGAACLSISPNEPRDRANEIACDAQLRFVISTDESRTKSLPAEFVSLEEPSGIAAAEQPENVQSGVAPDNAAIIRYTSGSTGKPKGVVNSHRSLTARLALGPWPDLRQQDVCMLKMSPRVFPRLAMGATVVISDDDMRDVQHLAHTVAKHAVTSLYVTPGILRQLFNLDSVMTNQLIGLRAVTTTGESLARDLTDRFREVLPEALLINAYASTESGGFAAMRVVNESWSEDSRSVGPPVAPTRIHILDEDMNPVPPGNVGEIYLTSPHIARGYLRRPDLTAAQFLPDPFSTRPGCRLFRTGDLARCSKGGEILLFDRTDHQVKIRGFRVELAEAESVLQDHAHVEECVVAARDAGTEKRLVAYIVATRTGRPTVGALREYLRRYLPDYMIPAAFVFMERLPRTSSGKVDRGALPEPDWTRPHMDTEYVAARNPVELRLTDIWASLLGIKNIGIYDNFLDLGGDSLAAMRLVAQLDEEFGLCVPAGAILELPTIAELASHIGASLKTVCTDKSQ